MGQSALGADWPESPWVNGPPRSTAIISAVAFVSPVDLQFLRMMHAWRRLDKRYGGLNVDFLIIAMQEPALPFSDALVENTAREFGYQKPILIDFTARYSRLWRAYVSPTVDLVLKNGKVTSFDPGNFDPATFEKALQKMLKENGATSLPAREFAADQDTKGCGHSHTLFFGDKFQKTFSADPVNFIGAWTDGPLYIEKKSPEPAQIEFSLNRAGLGVVGESTGGARVNVSLDGQKIPAEVRGKDVQEDKTGVTYFTIKSARVYEILNRASRLKDGNSKIVFSTEAKNLKLWAAETLPFCQEF